MGTHNEVNAVKIQGINIEHLDVGGIDLGLKGKHNFISAIILGIIFWKLGESQILGTVSSFLIIFGLLLFVGAAVKIKKFFKI